MESVNIDWNFHRFQICRHPNNIRKGNVGPGDVGLFEGGTPGCQCSLTLKETEAFLMPQALRFMLTSSWCDWSSWIPRQNETAEQEPIYILNSLTICKQSVLREWTSSVQFTTVLPSDGTVICRVRVVHMSRQGPLRVFFTGVSN